MAADALLGIGRRRLPSRGAANVALRCELCCSRRRRQLAAMMINQFQDKQLQLATLSLVPAAAAAPFARQVESSRVPLAQCNS